MKTEPSTSSTTPPVLPKRGEPEINPPPSVRGNLAWGVHWPWHKALVVANKIWWYNPLRHTTTAKYTSENTFARCHSLVGYLAKIVMLHAKWQRTRFGAKFTRTWNVPPSNLVISQIHKNIVRHTAHTIVSWPNPKQWLMINTSGLMMIIR